MYMYHYMILYIYILPFCIFLFCLKRAGWIKPFHTNSSHQFPSTCPVREKGACLVVAEAVAGPQARSTNHENHETSTSDYIKLYDNNS